MELKEILLKKFGREKIITEGELSYKEQSIYCDVDDLLDWITKNYISKQQILNLDCLKEEKDREQKGSSIDYNFDVEIKNQLRKEIIDEINKL